MEGKQWKMQNKRRNTKDDEKIMRGKEFDDKIFFNIDVEKRRLMSLRWICGELLYFEDWVVFKRILVILKVS